MWRDGGGRFVLPAAFDKYEVKENGGHCMQKALQEVLEQEFPFWGKLDAKEKEQMIAGAVRRKYEKGNMVHSASEKCLGLILVEQGRLRVYIESEEGRDITLYRLEQGDICTLSASCFMSEITFEVMIEAESDCSIVLMNPGVFNRIASENVYVENYMYKQTASRFSDVMWAMQQILFLSFDKRLALFLLDEVAKSGEDTLVMTHEQIAKYVGSAREVVSRMLKYFEEEGYVKLSRGKIQVLDEDALEKLIS